MQAWDEDDQEKAQFFKKLVSYLGLKNESQETTQRADKQIADK